MNGARFQAVCWKFCKNRILSRFHAVCYRPQTKFAKVMFLRVSVGPQRGRHVWQGACTAGGHAWQGGRAWLGGVHGRGDVHGWGVCMAGDVRGWGACVSGGHAWQGERACHSRYYGILSMMGRYASYWNAFLLINELIVDR